jgi:hypothetical protein
VLVELLVDVLDDEVGTVLDDVVEVGGAVVVGIGSHAHPCVHSSPAGQTSAPDGELASHSSPESRTPLPQEGGLVVEVVLDVVEVGGGVVVVLGGDVVVETGSHVHPGVHSSPAGQTSAPDGELGSHSSPESSTRLPQLGGVVDVLVLDDVVAAVPLVDVLELVGVVVVATGSHVHPTVHTSPAGHTVAPDGELGSHSSPESSTPLPQLGGVVVEVVLVEVGAGAVDVVVGAVVVETGSQVHPIVHTSPAGQTIAPDGELGSHSSPVSRTPLPQLGGVVVVGVVVVVLVDVEAGTLLVDVVVGVVVDETGWQVHPAVHSSPAGQTSAPDGELASHSSPVSRTPLPQLGGVVVVVVLVDVVDGAPLVDVVELGGDVVVETGSHVQPAVHCSPAGHTSAPDGELASHSSPASRTPLPHVGGIEVVLVDAPGVVVVLLDVLGAVVVVPPPALHSGG